MREGGLRRPVESEPKLEKGRERLLASAVLGLAGGVLVSAMECMPDASATSTASPHELSTADKQRLTKQVVTLRELIERLPATVQEASELQASEGSPDFRTLQLTPELLEEFPNKDEQPRRAGRTLLILDPDYSNWDKISKNKLEDLYQATLDDLIIDADESSVHVYSPSNEDLDIVLTLEKHQFGNEEVIFLGDTDGNSVGSWRVGQFVTEEVQKKVRQEIQSEIVDELISQENQEE